MTTLGKRIQGKRIALGMTQGDLGKLAGVNRTSVVAWESDKSQPHGTNLFKLAKLLNTETEWLRTGSGIETIDPTQPIQLPGPWWESGRVHPKRLSESDGISVPHIRGAEQPYFIHRNELSERWSALIWMNVPGDTFLPEGVHAGEIIILESDIKNAMEVEPESGFFLMTEQTSKEYYFAYWKSDGSIDSIFITPIGGATSRISINSERIVAHVVGSHSWEQRGKYLLPVFRKPVWWSDPSEFGNLSAAKRLALDSLENQFFELSHILKVNASDDQLIYFSRELRSLIDRINKMIQKSGGVPVD